MDNEALIYLAIFVFGTFIGYGIAYLRYNDKNEYQES